MGLFDRLRGGSRILTPAAAAAGARDGELLLVDVRDAAEFRAGHAEGALHVPLEQVGAKLDQLRRDGRTVAFVCRSGMRSAVATRTAMAAGLEAQNVRGGMLAWERAGLPVTTGSGRKRRRL